MLAQSTDLGVILVGILFEPAGTAIHMESEPRCGFLLLWVVNTVYALKEFNF